MAENRFPLPDAETIAKEFRDFAYSISHDLSAPSRAIVEFTRLLQEEQIGTFSEDGKLYLSLIIENGRKLQNMLEGLLDYSRLNTMEKSLSNVDLNVILKDCQIVLKDQIKALDATLEITQLPNVKADAEQIMQLFLILLDNALKFHIPSKKPSIWLSAQRQKEEWVFRIRDNGIGIETEFHNKIFKSFQRLHTDEEYPGIGMGLALAQKIVNRHGGNIWVESTPDPGSTFAFTLPQQEKVHG